VSAEVPDQRHSAGVPGLPRLAARLWAELRVFLELFVLCGFAITQPVLEVTGRSPEFFVFHRASRGDILLLLTSVTLLPAAAALAAELAAGLLGRQARRAAHLGLVAGLLTVLAVEVGKKLFPLRGGPLVALAVVAALTATWLLARRPGPQLWLRYLAPAPLVFVLLFALVSPVASLLRPHGQAISGTPGGMRGQRTPPVVMVFFDEFPLESLLDHRGRVDARMYPNFADLAGHATWYRNATGVNWFTPYAVPAMLTGRYPARVVAPIYTEYPDNLFTLLARTYDLKVFESVTQLCPPKLCAAATAARGRNTGFGVLAKETARAWEQIALPYDSQSDPSAQFAEETDAEAGQAPPNGKTGEPAPSFRFGQIKANQPSRFREFLDSFKADERPSFHFVHLLLPHTPWRYLPSGMQYFDPSRSFGRTKASIWGPQPWPVTVSHQRHLLQLAFTDHLVGELIERLRQVGLYDKALIVVTADHGGSFTPGQHVRIPAKGTAHETAWVPLLIKAPQQIKGRVDDRNWEHVDLVPTVADALGIHLPWRVDGVSALGSRVRTTTEKTFYVRPGVAGRVQLDGPSNLAVALRGVTDRLLRPQDGPIGLYKVGRYSQLVGRSAAGVGVRSPSQLAAKITPPTKLDTIDPSSGKVPAMVVGEIDGASSVPDPAIAVAVNGTIGGVSEVFRRGDARSFAAMVPDFLFRQDDNRVELFEVDPSGGTPRLRPIRWNA
jgi:Sulfatase